MPSHHGGIMTGDQLKHIRMRMEMDRHAFALKVIGYLGNDRNIDTRMRRLEAEEEVPLYIGRLVWLTLEYSRQHNGNLPRYPTNLQIEGEDE